MAQSLSNQAKIAGNAFAVVSAGSSLYNYYSLVDNVEGYPGHYNTLRLISDLGVTGYGVLGGLYGASANIGWEIGRLITQTNSYKNDIRPAIRSSLGIQNK